MDEEKGVVRTDLHILQTTVLVFAVILFGGPLVFGLTVLYGYTNYLIMLTIGLPDALAFISSFVGTMVTTGTIVFVVIYRFVEGNWLWEG